MNNSEKIEDLRHFLARYGLPPERPSLSLGVAEADRALGGGLGPGALHEVYAQDWAAGGFAACLAIRAAGSKPLFWVRPDYEALEYGALHAQGLAELGGRPENLFLVSTANAAEALAAAGDILACAPMSARCCWNSPACRGRWIWWPAASSISPPTLSGVTAILLREGAEAVPSAAQTRWQVSAAPSSATDDWGLPSFQCRTDPQPPWPHRLIGN